MDALKNQKVLLTQNSLRHIAGSEVVTLELAKYFHSQGAKTTVYTWALDENLKAYFDKANIKITTDDYDPDVVSPDIVWVHHQVIPIGLLEKMQDKKYQPRFYFYHMSAHDTLYLEQPYIYNLEKTFATKSLFVSEEALQFNLKKYSDNSFTKPSIFPNSFPDEYLQNSINNHQPYNILIVSNHPPKEVKLAEQLLTNQNLKVSSLGHNESSYQIISPDLLKKYDAVITIGKTVQYCLAMNIPVFIYDKFGGCGYLNSKNYEKAKFANFSGRGFHKKTPEQISTEIITHFKAAKSFQTKNHEAFIKNFSLSKNMSKTLSTKPRTIKLDEHFLNYLIAAENLARCVVLVEQNKNLETQIQNLNQNITEKEQLIATKNQIIRNMENSRTVKIAKKIKSLSSKIKTNQTNPLKPYRKNYKTIFIQKSHKNSTTKIIGLIREKNESLILEDTLTELEKIVDGFILLDDNSDDNSIEIAKKHPKCLAIIKNSKTITGNRSMEESIHRELLLELAKTYHPQWIFYQDADERVENPVDVRNFMLNNINSPLIEAISFSFFDAYMTKNDSQAYHSGSLFNFRKLFGPERRDIVMAWKNNPDITFMTRADLRVPDHIDPSKTITKFYVQHYGKALSVEQWEETCDYYIKHFPQYAEKWQARKGKGIHNTKSDFNRPLDSWHSIKKSGGIKIN